MDEIGQLPAEVSRAIRGVERAMGRLIKLLKSPEESVRQEVIGALDAMGIAAVGYLAVGLNTSRDPAYRIRIVEVLGMLAPLSRTTVLLVLAEAARDRDPAVREATARVVWGLKSIHAPAPSPSLSDAVGQVGDPGGGGLGSRRSTRSRTRGSQAAPEAMEAR